MEQKKNTNEAKSTKKTIRAFLIFIQRRLMKNSTTLRKT